MIAKSLLRRGEARAYLQISDRRFRRLLREGRIVARRWRGTGRAWFVVVELDAVRVRAGAPEARVAV